MDEDCKCVPVGLGCNMASEGAEASAPAAGCTQTLCPPPQPPALPPDCEDSCDCGCG